MVISKCAIFTAQQNSEMWKEDIECFSRKLVIEPGLDGLKYLL
jgi:hypothetical protein